MALINFDVNLHGVKSEGLRMRASKFDQAHGSFAANVRETTAACKDKKSIRIAANAVNTTDFAVKHNVF
jgi:hypothetical protein